MARTSHCIVANNVERHVQLLNELKVRRCRRCWSRGCGRMVMHCNDVLHHPAQCSQFCVVTQDVLVRPIGPCELERDPPLRQDCAKVMLQTPP